MQVILTVVITIVILIFLMIILLSIYNKSQLKKERHEELLVVERVNFQMNKAFDKCDELANEFPFLFNQIDICGQNATITDQLIVFGDIHKQKNEAFIEVIFDDQNKFILFDSETNNLLKNDIIQAIINNFISQENFIAYDVDNYIQNNKIKIKKSSCEIEKINSYEFNLSALSESNEMLIFNYKLNINGGKSRINISKHDLLCGNEIEK